jgi:gas vesicle protein
MGDSNMAKIKRREISTKSHSKRSLPNQVPFVNHTSSYIVLGAAAGCALGAAAAYFLNAEPKRHKFTQKLDEIYDSISGIADEYSHDAIDKGQKVYQAAKDSAETICSTASKVFCGDHANRNIILGVLGAGLLGASAVYALNQNAMSSRSTFMDKWSLKKWPEMAKFVVDAVSNKIHNGEEHAISELPHSIQNALDWAMTGLNLWQEIKKRR